MTYQYKTHGTCSQMIEFELEDGIIRSVVFYGGCQGNTQGLSALLRGMKVEDAIGRLEGIQCGMKGTSCPDQFARALKQTLSRAMSFALVMVMSVVLCACGNSGSTRTEDDRAVVYFTRQLDAEGFIRAYEMVQDDIEGQVAVKLHTGEPNGPNILPREWVSQLMDKDLPGATIVETNTYYRGNRYTTEQHRQTLETNGWTFCPVDILDEEDTTLLPVVGGKWFSHMSVGSHLTRYNSLVTLTHFKGHSIGGFGGSNKNIGIGCADGRVGKAWIHTTPDSDRPFNIREDEFMERMTESTKSVIDYFGSHVCYVNVMRNMSVSCDCEGVRAAPVVTPNVGILSSKDILAIDQACVDIIYAMTEEQHHDMVERMESRHGLRQLTYMKELGMGSDRYVLIDLDNDCREITPAEAAQGLQPFSQE